MERNKFFKYFFATIYFAIFIIMGYALDKLEYKGTSFSFEYLTEKFSPPVAFSMLVVAAIIFSSPLYSFLMNGGGSDSQISRIRNISLKNWIVIICVAIGGLYLAYMFFILSIGASMPSFFGYLNKLYSQFVLGGL